MKVHQDFDANRIEIQSAKKLPEDSATISVMPEEETKKEKIPPAIIKPCENFESELTGLKQNLFEQFKTQFDDIVENDIYNYYFCTDSNCHEISSKDTNKSSGDKFQHKWLTDPELAQCGETHEWCLLCIKGKGMFSPLCRQYDVKQSNGLKQWNSVANVRFRTQTVKDHFQKST